MRCCEDYGVLKDSVYGILLVIFFNFVTNMHSVFMDIFMLVSACLVCEIL